MKSVFLSALFLLATLSLASAQQPEGAPGQPGMQGPGAGPMQAPTPGNPGQTPGAQNPGMQPGPMASQTVTEGCLGGSNPNFTITDASGTTYKLNIPPAADASKLAAHVGESVNVAGPVNGAGSSSSIDVQGIGRGTGTCPAGGSKASPQSQPK